MKIKAKNVAIIGGALTYGFIKYSNFEHYINNLKLGLEILEVKNGYATAIISNINNRHIPYTFNSINLVINGEINAAVNNECSTNLSIVPFSKIPINFRTLDNFTKEDLINSEIVIEYNFAFLNEKRIYKPIIISSSQEVIDVDNSSCGCNN